MFTIVVDRCKKFGKKIFENENFFFILRHRTTANICHRLLFVQYVTYNARTHIHYTYINTHKYTHIYTCHFVLYIILCKASILHLPVGGHVLVVHRFGKKFRQNLSCLCTCLHACHPTYTNEEIYIISRINWCHCIRIYYIIYLTAVFIAWICFLYFSYIYLFFRFFVRFIYLFLTVYR